MKDPNLDNIQIVQQENEELLSLSLLTIIYSQLSYIIDHFTYFPIKLRYKINFHLLTNIKSITEC